MVFSHIRGVLGIVIGPHAFSKRAKSRLSHSIPNENGERRRAERAGKSPTPSPLSQWGRGERVRSAKRKKCLVPFHTEPKRGKAEGGKSGEKPSPPAPLSQWGRGACAFSKTQKVPCPIPYRTKTGKGGRRRARGKALTPQPLSHPVASDRRAMGVLEFSPSPILSQATGGRGEFWSFHVAPIPEFH